MTSRDNSHASPIDAYLAELVAQLTVEPTERATILEEIRGHLEEATAAEVARGSTAAEAESRAVAAFGSVATTARSINSTLPLYWDWRQMARGVVLGALAIWVIWTLATFPFIVPMATEHQLDVSTSPASLLFTASPLGFGLFYVLRNGPWAALLILALFGAIAFALGSRASTGWRAGLAFGLGVIVGLPFLLPAIFYTNSFIRPLAMLLFILPIWLLVPYAGFTSWLGARIARTRDTHALRRPPTTTSGNRHQRRLSTAIIVGLFLLVTLLGVSGWSFVRAATILPSPTIPVSQQLASAQRQLSFTIRQPGYLPAGTTLTSVDVAEAWCAHCSVSLNYHISSGADIFLYEIPHNPSAPESVGPDMPPLLPSSPDAPDAYSSVTAVSYHQTWWLGADEKTEQQRSLSWDDGTLQYGLITNAPLSAATLKQIALSLYG
ncbi:MAG TPA: permease prefix domain 1-containing protein [Ktedonobacterales bacterium]|jgi:hypothetical protein|nr:permease prefix domain 1-containing protein [Ktedonobacterales bacterium]